MGEVETDDVLVQIIDEREKSFLLSTEGKSNAWFPKRELVFIRRNGKTGVALAKIPIWLLEDRGW